MKPLLVVAGIPGEIRSFVRDLPGAAVERVHGARFFFTPDIVVGSAGPGKVRAAATVETAIRLFDPRAVLCVGTCGGLGAESAPGDVIIPDRVLEHDVDWRASGLPRGHISRTNGGISPDEGLVDRVTALEWTKSQRVFFGTLLTGDTVVDARVLDERPELEGELGGIAVEMETAAVAGVARMNRIPWVAVRVVTDVPRASLPGEGISAPFRREFPRAAEKISRFLRAYLLAESVPKG